MTQRPTATPPIFGLLPATHVDALLAQGYAAVKLTDDEITLLRALAAAAPDGLRGSEAATVLGSANRLYVGHVCRSLVKLRLARKMGRTYHLRKDVP